MGLVNWLARGVPAKSGSSGAGQSDPGVGKEKSSRTGRSPDLLIGCG